MSFDKTKAGKMLAQLQIERDALERSGDTDAAEQLTSAISSILLAAGVADEPLMPKEHVDELRRKANTEPNMKRREDAQARLAIETQKIALHGLIGKLEKRRR